MILFKSIQLSLHHLLYPSILLISFIILSTGPNSVSCQYDDVRCKCLCPIASVVTNETKSTRKLYIGNVPPNQCNCDFVVLPQLTVEVQGKAKEFCPRCECKYESRNTAIIRFFVIFIIGIISFLVVYMIFLSLLDPWIHKRSIRSNYQQQINEEVSLREQNVPASTSDLGLQTRRRLPASPLHEPEETTPKGVLNRVQHTQSKWKRQVKEQRKNIYDDHSMLN
ncbi:PREDICTED: transmembrane protein 9-like [Rhagoletis zephyria]|uniref:transmembrane protein 9-like n=1 Tax=Rhagoletis zephyria TaxID=28612 RepID=UPI000811A420|nr:PREDICTED: transmembrane protein 9-like [Rhagoletis zephyria]